MLLSFSFFIYYLIAMHLIFACSHLKTLQNLVDNELFPVKMTIDFMNYALIVLIIA